MSDVRIDTGVVSGTFSLDGETHQVDNNVWVVGDDDECVVIDAPHDVTAIRELIGDRRVLAIVCTHAHDDHVRVAPELAHTVDAPILLHPDDAPVWQLTHPDTEPDSPLADGKRLMVAGMALEVLHTPGHSPGAICLYAPDLGVVFTGDTLFAGGPAPPGVVSPTTTRSWRASAKSCSPCAGETVVHSGHGDSSTIDAERF
ncbi:MAG: MBL fold metallo-hydrolase [Nocardioidaceae bacterium]